MPRVATSSPVKFCEWCKKPMQRKRYPPRGALECNRNFQKRRFCSLSCFAFHQHSTEPPSVAAARKRAYKMVKRECEACGTTFEMSVHHLDENPRNNEPSNHQTLCLSCHGFWHRARKRSPKQMPDR